jgi:hypothetical protein
MAKPWRASPPLRAGNVATETIEDVDLIPELTAA